MNRTIVMGIGAAVAALALHTAQASVQESGKVKAEDLQAATGSGGDRIYSPYVDREYPDQVLFGDAHSHTNLSLDAGLLGTTLDVETSYRFARGEAVTSNTGQKV